jgi:hypothetical protein
VRGRPEPLRRCCCVYLITLRELEAPQEVILFPSVVLYTPKPWRCSAFTKCSTLVIRACVTELLIRALTDDPLTKILGHALLVRDELGSLRCAFAIASGHGDVYTGEFVKGNLDQARKHLEACLDHVRPTQKLTEQLQQG